MRIIQVTVAFLFLLLLAAALFAQTASSPVTTSQTLPVSGTVSDPCTNENVALDGTIQLSAAVWSDSNGATHVRTNEYFNVSGVGQTSGLSYNVIGGSTQVEYSTTDPAPQEMTLLVRMNVNGSGPVPNEVARTLMQLTVAANGNVNGFVDSMTPTCPGH